METESQELVGLASAKAPGTCGELAQGIQNGEYFLVSCPIDIYSTATVSLSKGTGDAYGPEDSPKARRAVELTLDYFSKFSLDAHLQLESNLPRGKGMASSTADVTAAIYATAEALGKQISPRQAAEIALWVEPSDGVMFPGISMLDHRNGRMAQVLGAPPPMRVLILDFGGTIDTLQFNDVDRRAILKRQESRLQEAVALISEGILSRDVSIIGRGATISAIANQGVLYKPYLDAVLDLVPQVGAAGLNVAHSGTVTGMIFPDDESLVKRAMTVARQRLRGLENITQAKIIGGGAIPINTAVQEARG